MNHFNISLVKSLLRILGSIGGLIYILVGMSDTGLIFLATLFGIAEILGILEEIFDKRKEK